MSVFRVMPAKVRAMEKRENGGGEEEEERGARFKIPRGQIRAH